MALRLCINADDFGYSTSVNRGIFEAVEAGVVTSVSAMARHAAVSEVARLPRDRVSVGLHVSLTTGENPHVRARARPTTLAVDWALRRLDPGELEAEVESQLAALEAVWSGPISHFDSHQNVHLLPSVRTALRGVARRHGVPYVREALDVSPGWSAKKAILAATSRPVPGSPAFFGVQLMDRGFRPDDVLAHLDHLESMGVTRALWMVHPGHTEDLPAGDPYREDRAHELAVLLGLAGALRDRAELVPMAEVLAL